MSWFLEAKASLRLAIPLAMIQVSEGAAHFVDTLMMGWLDTATLAAGGLGATVFWTLLSLCTGLLEMTGALAAEAHGACALRRVSQINIQGLWLSLAISPVMMVLIWYLDTGLRLCGQQEAIVVQATAYLRAIVWGFPAALGLFVFKEMTTALARPRMVTILMMMGIPLNIGLNYGLMYGALGLPRLGLAGIGWASTIVFWVNFSLALGLLHYNPRLRQLQLFRAGWRCERAILTEIIRLGWPLCVDYGTEFGALTTAALLMGIWGTELLAAHHIVMSTTELLSMFSWGFAYAAAVRTGHKLGRGEPQGARQVGNTTMVLNLGLVVILAVPLWLSPETIAGFYVDAHHPENAETVRIAASLFRVGVVFQIFQGMRLISAGTLQGLKDTYLLATVDVLAHWGIGLGLGYLTGHWLGWRGIGLWWSLALGQMVAAFVLTVRFQRLIITRIGCGQKSEKGKL